MRELQELQSTLTGRQVVNVFTVPDGYFDSFSGSVMHGITGDSIIKTVIQPAGSNVPEGYFDSLADSILSKIKQQTAAEADEPLSPLLEGLRHNNVFKVPPGYFEALGGNIAARLTTGDELPALLQDLKHKQVFEVPQGYFDSLSTQIISKLKPAPAKLVNMRSSLRIIKYAVAAVFTGVMALSIYKYTQPQQAQLSAVHEAGMILSKDEVKYNSEFEKVSDETIVKFLETEGQDVDAALAAMSVDEKELPTEDELMLDDKTLDDFLNNINNKDLNN